MIDVWTACLDQPPEVAERLAGCLSAAERERALRYRSEPLRRFALVGRALLRRLLAPYAGGRPEDLRFAYGPFGKPALVGAEGVHFNLSHSGDRFACAVTALCPLGIDIEVLRELDGMAGLAERFFAPGEIGQLRRLPGGELLPAFFRCWTRKEAFLKATGEGLSRSLGSFEVAVDEGAEPALLGLDGDRAAAAAWGLYSFVPAPGHIGTVALPRRGCTLRVRSLAL